MSNIVSLISNEELSKVSYINLNQTALAHDTTDDVICPTLIMARRLDPICSMVGTDAMTSSVQNAETVIFEKSSYFFMIEEAEKSMNTLIDWFNRHTP
jgi:pimeloyl-ACP methyl ester carboxylesterase